jgi:hypothetical protein
MAIDLGHVPLIAYFLSIDSNMLKIRTVPSLDGILYAMSDEKSLSLLSMIANEFDKGADKDSLLEKVDLTRKQFYLRISSLLSTGLINRILGRYCITSFGKINYEIQLLLGMAVDKQMSASEIEKIPLSSQSNTFDTTDATHGNAMIVQPISRVS